MKSFLQHSSNRRGARRQRGFTLIEMMVAVSIGLVVALGLAVSFVNLKTTWGTQDKLAQLQDNERLAMAFLTSSVQEAGYYPDPTNASPLPAYVDSTGKYGNLAAGQGIMGTALNGSTSATLSTVYATASGDGVLTCQGGTNGTGATVNIRNVFYVNTTTHTLNCIVYANNGTATAPGAADAPLISNVSSMDVRYAVVDASGGVGNANAYLTATDMTAARWNAIKAVRITLNFINPNAALDGNTTIPWVQTINLMNNQ